MRETRQRIVLQLGVNAKLFCAIFFAVFIGCFSLGESLRAQGVPDTANERITDFRSEIYVHVNGKITVTENIFVLAAGDQIKRGIYRDIPLVRMNEARFYDVDDITVVRVQLDGRAAPYRTEELSGAIRIYVGDPTRLLPHGEHSFSITYTMTNQIAHGSAIDELYWNVTGNDWQFLIEKATARVHLPYDASILDLSVYTGPKGSKVGRGSVVSEAGSLAVVNTINTMVPGDGMTVAISWPSGHVLRPTVVDNNLKFLVDNKGIFLGILLFAAQLAYFIWAWRGFGKDPKGPTVVPRFEPPTGLSAAEVGFLWREAKGSEGYTTKAFAVILTSLAVKKFLSITVTGKEEYSVSGMRGEYNSLPDDELTVLNSLLRQDNASEITIGREYRKEVQSARSFIGKRYNSNKRSHYFVRNEQQWRIGCFIGVLVVAAVIMLDPLHGASSIETMIGTAIGSGFFIVAAALIFNVFRSIWAALRGSGDIRADKLVKLVFICAAMMAPVLTFGFLLVTSISPIALVLPIVAVVTCCLFHIWLEVPTSGFLKVRAEIEGYRRYLTVAEEDRLNFRSSEMVDAIDLFEKHLPYAMALDAEGVWTERLQRQLTSMVTPDGEGPVSYNPVWYQDSRRGWSGIGDFGTRSAGQFSAAAVSYGAPVSQPVGLASGGGGSSGGGGGGGGGGGW